MTNSCRIIGAPIEIGASQRGCIMGPASLRTAGIVETVENLGWNVCDSGDLSIAPQAAQDHPNKSLHHLAETIAWTKVLQDAGQEAIQSGQMPIFLGGDHSMSAGTVSGVAKFAAAEGRPMFVLWLDAHTDFHTLHTTDSGNIHGTPAAYFTGQTGFEGFPENSAPVPTENVCMMGIRSVDQPEHDRLLELGVNVQDMRAIDETGVLAPLKAFLDRVRAENGMLHVSFDVDFLEPTIAPAVGTTVPGGATFREAHLIMETLYDSGLVTSLDLAELNPFLDEKGRTASLLVDLTASLLGRRVLGRQTRSFAS